MKKKLISMLLFALGAGILAGGAFMLPVLANSRLKAEYETVHVKEKEEQAQEKVDTEQTGQEIQAQKKVDTKHTGREIQAKEEEEYFRMVREEIKSELGIEADAFAIPMFQAGNEEGDLTLTWSKDVPPEVEPQDNVYYSGEFSVPAQEGQAAVLKAAGVAGTQYGELAQQLAQQAKKSFADQFQEQVPEEIPVYAAIDWKEEERQVKLQWELPDYDTNTYTVYEAVFCQVNDSYTEGVLDYLNYFHTKLGSYFAAPELTQEETDTLAGKAKTCAKQLGYEPMELKGTYYYGNTVNFCFSIKDPAFDEVCISMEEDGTWTGQAVGNDIRKYARADK